jgi:hypothetical protein
MSENRTVIRPSAPRFAINEIAYSRVSATKGFVEPLPVYGIEFVPSVGKYRYTFSRKLDVNHQNRRVQLIAAKLFEDQLITLCEALDIQISVIQRQYDEMYVKYQAACPDGVVLYEPVQVYESARFMVQPPQPRFGHNDVVFLKETSQTTGVLEAFRIKDMSWDTSRNMWLYKFEIKPRPERTMSVGDADNWHRSYIIAYYDVELSTYCEALYYSVQFLYDAVTAATTRRAALCPSSGSST